MNPGLLPIGVTPTTVLHATVRRNEHLARVFHDLKLMEREGTGFDTMYQVLLSQGRPAPEMREGPDRVEVTVRRRIIKPEVIDMLAKADERFQLGQREKICLGLLAQSEQMSARDLVGALMLGGADDLRPWLGRLQQLGLVESAGRTKATRYFVAPSVLRDMELPTTTTLGRIEPHRLEALIIEDLRRHPGSATGEINHRIGAEIAYKRIYRTLTALVNAGKIERQGAKKGVRYRARP